MTRRPLTTRSTQLCTNGTSRDVSFCRRYFDRYSSVRSLAVYLCILLKVTLLPLLLSLSLSSISYNTPASWRGKANNLAVCNAQISVMTVIAPAAPCGRQCLLRGLLIA